MKNATYLVIQNTYDTVEMGLYSDDCCIDRVCEDKMSAGKMTVPLVSALLERNKCSFSQLTFIAANQGPAPFTTLRIIIATVNGFAFATSLPLVGLDGLRALLEQHKDDHYPITIALLDAFNKDVYVGIAQNGQVVYTGCQSIEEFLPYIKQTYRAHKIHFVGAGSIMYEEQINAVLHNRAVIIKENQLCSLDFLAQQAYKKWIMQQDISSQLFPLYLKQQQYKNQLGQIKKI